VGSEDSMKVHLLSAPPHGCWRLACGIAVWPTRQASGEVMNATGDRIYDTTQDVTKATCKRCLAR